MSNRVSPPAQAVVTPGTGQGAHGVMATMHVVRPSLSHPDNEQPLACPHCHATATAGMRFCRECGAPFSHGAGHAPTEPQPVRSGASCWRCHAERDPSSLYCRYCGAAQLDPHTPPFQELPQGALSGPAASSSPEARLVTLLKDGSEGRSVPLSEGNADIGAHEGDVTFSDDPYMSARHARVSCRSGTYILRDLDSVNGVYVRLREETELRGGDMVLLGQQVLRFEVLSEGELSLGPAWQAGVLVFGTPETARFGRLVQYTTEGIGRDVHYLFRDETVIGRENGDIVFTDDPFLSRRHAVVRVDRANGRFTLHDLGSSNGTALRIRGEHVLRDGDQFRIGRHLFRFHAGPAGGRAGR